LRFWKLVQDIGSGNPQDLHAFVLLHEEWTSAHKGQMANGVTPNILHPPKTLLKLLCAQPVHLTSLCIHHTLQ
jgi:hypothetical protein